VALTAGAERRVAGLDEVVDLGGDSGPDDGLLLPAATGPWSDASKGAWKPGSHGHGAALLLHLAACRGVGPQGRGEWFPDRFGPSW
jgi:hypothetical protein